MGKEAVKCCLYCGRDTMAKSQICVRCTGHTPSFEEYQGRKALPPHHWANSALDDFDDDQGGDD